MSLIINATTTLWLITLLTATTQLELFTIANASQIKAAHDLSYNYGIQKVVASKPKTVASTTYSITDQQQQVGFTQNETKKTESQTETDIVSQQQRLTHMTALNKQIELNTSKYIRSNEQKLKITADVASLRTRAKRQETQGAKSAQNASPEALPQLQNYDELFGLPTVPLPPPPPFKGTGFGISPFASNSINANSSIGNKVMHTNAFNAFNYASSAKSSPGVASSSPHCGGTLKARHGIIQTPNFPHKFDAPLECVWIIDASELPTISSNSGGSAGASTNVSIIVYFTQLYVLSGLRFTEYMYYSDDFKVPAHRIFQLTEDDVTQVAWIQFHSQYLEIRFTMNTLEGTQLRALDRLLDVYGFNITYEVQQHVKPNQCNTLQCRFLGNCFAKADYSSYYCDCYAGFSGNDCGHGPLCDDPHTNVCQNGGTCKHIGDAAITCHCPAGYKGTKCEIPEINETTMGCTINSTLSSCHRDCEFTDTFVGSPLSKSSRHSGRTGMTRYEVTIRLSTNLTTFYRNTEAERRSNDYLPMVLEKHLMRVLRNFNITRISDLEIISNTSDRLDITFHFFGINVDSSRIREAITRMVERGRIGNITLVSNYHRFQENPPLDLLDMSVNHPTAIREDSEFIISCTAQGSARMQFQWYKDGAIVNASKAIRQIWTTVLPPETKDIFTAILGVTKAGRIDEGIYTCKVVDWGVEQCRSVHIHIKLPPRLRVDPASVTLYKGDSLRVRCLSPGNDDIKRYAQLGYSWTRNGMLFQSDPNTIMWEDLYPDGSILKINNIQKSAEFSCVVSNPVKPVSKSVYITVVDRNTVHVCPKESLYHVHWPTSAPGSAIIAECPRGFEGYTRRVCEKRDAGNSSWLLPDFSNCLHDQLLMIYKKFQALSSGYQQTNSSIILKKCLDYTLKRHKSFLPGEAGFLIDMLHELDIYLQLKGTQLEREMAAEIILHILDKVMQNAQSLNSQQQIKKLQLLTQSAALNRETIAASQLATSTSTAAVVNTIISTATATKTSATSSSSAASVGSSASSATEADSSSSYATLLKTATGNGSKHKQTVASIRTDAATGAGAVAVVDEDSSSLSSSSSSSSSPATLSLDRLNSLRIYMTSVKTLPFNLRIYGDDLFSDQLYMDIGLSPRLVNIMANATIFASVISYKNLKSFLPKTYYTRGSDPQEQDYILASRIIQTWLFQSNRSNDNFREPLDLPFEAGHVEIIFQHESTEKHGDWIAVCGHDYKASFESTWRSDLCITKNLMANITRCICPLSGTYVVMLTKRNHSIPPTLTPQHPLFVIISCACCLLQSSSTFLILLPIWFNRKCAITFLKMQFCVSTSSIMIIFLLGFLKMLPVNWHAIVSTSLASLLLLGVSTLIAIALVIHTELVPKKYIQCITKRAATSIKQQQQQKYNPKEQPATGNSTSGAGSINISLTQVSSNVADSNTNLRARPPTPPAMQEIQLPSGKRGAIGISWLLPLLFAITISLICSIIGKWPQHWWLDIMYTTFATHSTTDATATSTTSAYDMFATNTTTTASFNGSIFLSPSSTLHTNAVNVSPTTTSASMTTTASNSRSGVVTATTASSSTSSIPSLNFIIFLCIELLFILLFIALLIILIKKLLWLWRKHRNVHVHPMDKFNVAMRRRRGLLYRTGCLLIAKECVEGLFITYVNAGLVEFWGYLFGVACILQGFSILFCFIIKPEVSLRDAAFRHSSSKHSSSSSSIKHKLSASKSSLDETYCSGTINSPLSFYTNQEKEKENDSAPPDSTTVQQHQHLAMLKAAQHQQQTLEMSQTNVQMPLTIISTAPRCQMMPTMMGGGSVSLANDNGLHAQETFLGSNSYEHKVTGPLHVSCLQQDMQQPNKILIAPASNATVASPATRCCAILGVSMGGGGSAGVGNMTQTHTLPHGTTSTGLAYYDAYGIAGMTNSLGRRTVQQHHQQKHQQIAHEFVGVETLDILQGVAADTILGIRTSNISSNNMPVQYHQQQQQYTALHHNPYVDSHIFVQTPSQLPPTAAIVSVSGHTTASQNYSQHQTGMTATTITTTSVTTQTPKAQKRVTIMEPTTHNTFDPMLPTMVAVSAGTTTLTTTYQHQQQQLQQQKHAQSIGTATVTSSTAATAPKITVTGSSIDEPDISGSTANTGTTGKIVTTPNGMFDRITHDLDFLLNRTNEIPSGSSDEDLDLLPPPPLPPAGIIPTATATASDLSSRQHNSIMEEENEQEL